MHFGGYRLAVIVDRVDVEACLLAGANGIADRLDADAITSIGREKASTTGDLPIGFVRYPRLDGVVEVTMPFAAIDLGRDRDGELAVCVQGAGLLRFLGRAV